MRSESVRYAVNPFIKDMVLPVRGKNVQVSCLGKDNNILVNQDTGEILGTHVVTRKKVDTEQFVKLFTANIALVFDLGCAGIKAFNVLVWAVQCRCITRDIVAMDNFTREDFLDNQDKKLALSKATFDRGIRELEQAGIIAKHEKPGQYFINPNFIFNGSRIAFTSLIERVS